MFDHQRPLAPRGRREGPLAGAAIRADFPMIDVVLCSDSVRTSQTLEVSGLAEVAGEVRYESDIYEAGLPDLLRVIGTLPDEAQTALIVGHAPGLPSLVFELCDSEARPGLLAEVEVKFPTSAFAVLEVPSWSAPHGATLLDFQIPRA